MYSHEIQNEIIVQAWNFSWKFRLSLIIKKKGFNVYFFAVLYDINLS